jgi:hypothetical protein
VIGEVPAQGLTGKAHGYLSSQWPELVRVLDDGRFPPAAGYEWSGKRDQAIRGGREEPAVRRHGPRREGERDRAVPSDAELDPLLPHRIDRTVIADPRFPPISPATAST